MAQISQNLYRDIADAYATIDVALSGISTNARTALDAIVDVATTTYPLNPSAIDADAALEIELALLQTFNAAYVGAQSIGNSNAALVNAVTAVNDFVITNSGEAGTATVKLTNWVNAEMDGYWTGSACPEGWANISADAGYTTTDWVTV